MTATHAYQFRPVPKPAHNQHAIAGPTPAPLEGRKRTSLSWKLFGLWAWSPIISFQVGLTVGYAAMVYFGVAALIAPPAAFKFTSPGLYALGWAVALTLGAVAAGFGSISRHRWFELAETAGASLLTLTIGSYASLLHWAAYAVGDPDRVAPAAAVTALAIPVIVRTMWLYSQLLRK
jgi:hypothetical protein